ncbi:hypothetical protein INH39_25560 [Massilia violaceinigra]|uniref:Scaffolding protein n=1 Tax=Massilia violaceinigra TaxID=2045208 RepID=A0ABY4A410_9BURK|nr:hypothetical protein [Massilia violaceinigra]UOD28779.1 hypothetical protein INH39_25560 [Massilia violaceinigra]
MDNPTSESSNEPLDANGAANAFSSLLGDDGPEESESQQQNDDSPEAAAERLAKQELTGADEGQPDEGEGDPEPEADDVTVVIDGKTVKLTKAQIAENYRADMRDKDYRQKTMAAAEERKAATAEKQQASRERQEYAQKLHNYAAQMDGGIAEQSAMLTQELLETDPVQYLSIERTVKERQANLAQAQQELQRINQIHQQEQTQTQQAYMADQQAQLLAKIPEWKDGAKARAEAGAINEYLNRQGFAEQDVSAITDHRQLVLARKAMQYDALIERAGKAVKKVAALPVKAERSGSAEVSKPDGRTEAMKRLGKTGSINDAADAFSKFL